MRSSPDVPNVSSDTVLLTAKAAELFLALLASESINKSRNKTLEYNHISHVVHTDPRFAFLKDIIPKKIVVREYRNILKEVETEEAKVGRTVCFTDLERQQQEVVEVDSDSE